MMIMRDKEKYNCGKVGGGGTCPSVPWVPTPLHYAWIEFEKMKEKKARKYYKYILHIIS